MAIGPVVTRGYGSFGSAHLVVTRGYHSSSVLAHAATGALVGPGAVIVGTAHRTRAHAASGVLVGPGALIVGTAHHARPHATTGVLVGPGALIVGTAHHAKQHATTGILVGPGAVIVGVAHHTGAYVPPPAGVAALIEATVFTSPLEQAVQAPIQNYSVQSPTRL